MDVEFRDINGNRVGIIIGTDVKDNYGNRVGYISGNEIRTTNGKKAGINNGNDIRDNYGNRIGYLNGNEIRDTYGNKVGYPVSSASEIEMVAAALLLFNLTAETTTSGSTQRTSKREKPSGCLGWFTFIIVGWFMFILKSNWGGKIGLILGVILTIFFIVTGGGADGLNTIFLGIFIILFIGTIGAAIGEIIKFIKRQVDKNK